MDNMTGSRLSGEDLARRRVADARFSADLDAIEAAEAVVRAAEATRTRMIIRAVDDVETTIAPVIGAEFAHRNLVAEIALALRVSEMTAGMLVSTATIARALPATIDSLEAGRISYRHVAAIAEQARLLPIAAVAEFENAALPYAEEHTVPATTRQVRVLRERLHPESIGERTITALSERRVWMTPLPDGMVEIGAILPAIEGEAIMGRLTRIATAQRATKDEDRTLAQLEVDAFTDLLLGEDATTAGTHDRTTSTLRVSERIQPRVTITVPLISMVGQSEDPADLVGYGPLDPDIARRLAERAPYLTRLITDPISGQPLQLDPTRYRPNRRLRRWIAARDRHCRFPGCHRRVEATDIDHGIPRVDGGGTEPGNLALLCRHHHRLKDTGGWSVAHSGNGILTWTSPAGRTYVTEPDGNDPDTAFSLLFATCYTEVMTSVELAYDSDRATEELAPMSPSGSSLAPVP